MKDKSKLILCPNCKRNITSMKNLHKKHKFNWICKCGQDVSKIKLQQLIDKIKEETGTDDVTVLSYLPIF